MRRIRVVHAASLNGENRKRLQLLYGILVQHFASLAGSRGWLPMEQLDALLLSKSHCMQNAEKESKTDAYSCRRKRVN